MNCRKNKNIFALAVLLTLVMCFAAPAAAQKNTKFVAVSGRNFVAPDGKTIALKGINLGNWLLPEGYMFGFKAANSPQKIYTAFNQLVGEAETRRFWKSFQENYITQEDIKFIKKSGFNSVRVPFSYRLFVSAEDPRRLEGSGYELLDKVVGWCRQENLYVVLDMHAAPGGQTGDNIDDGFGYPFLFESTEDQDQAAAIWRKIGARYANDPIIIGYDLLNEPIATHFDKEYFNPKLEPLYRKIATAIREVDKNHILFLGGAQWDSNFKVFGAPFDSKLAYTFHKYWVDVNQQTVQEYVDFADKYNVPLWMGESGENKDEWIKSFRELLDKNEIGWCFWTYKRMDATATIASVNKPENWNGIIEFTENPRATFEEVRKTRLPREKAAAALNGYLENIKFKNCRINGGYLQALGLQ